MKNSFRINELNCNAWTNAMINVAVEIGNYFDISINSDDTAKLTNLCNALGIKFDMNGEIIK